MGGGDDAHVHLLDPRRSQRLHLAFLEDAQQLGLHRQRQLADLVEQQRAAVGLGEVAGVGAGGAGEGAAGVAEQLRLGQLVRDGRAVELHQRPPGARAVRVQAASR